MTSHSLSCQTLVLYYLEVGQAQACAGLSAPPARSAGASRVPYK